MPKKDDAVVFHLEGDPQEYRLHFDFNQIVAAEELTGCNLLHALDRPAAMSAVQMRALLYACLRTAHQVELDEAGDLLTKDLATVTRKLGEVLGASAEPEDEPPAAPPA